MVDINFIRENTEIVKKAVQVKGINLDIDQLIEVDSKRRDLLTKVEALRQQRNQAAQNRDIEKGKQVKIELDGLEDQLRQIEQKFADQMLSVPNIPSSDSPIGPNSESNEIVDSWGEKPDFDFEIKDHIQLGKSLDIIDLEAGTKTSGFRGYYLKNQGAILHQAVLNYALHKIQSEGFSMMVPPTLVNEKVLIGSGHFPFGKENIYQISNPGKLETGEDVKNPMYLTGTSEPSLLAYYMDQVLNEDQLPLKVCALTHCYRSEVGDYGKDTKGLYRVHEFDKVEQVVICKNNLEESEKWFETMLKTTQTILQELGISYQVVKTSTGDMGAGKYRMSDIEIWMPGRNKYGEICSNSNLTDWQMRRTNTRYKTKEGKTLYPHALNSTVIASPRVLIAILENFQQADGSVKIPEVLQKYTGFSEIRPK